MIEKFHHLFIVLKNCSALLLFSMSCSIVFPQLFSIASSHQLFCVNTFFCLYLGNRPALALGMTNAKILDAQLSASSSDAGWEPKHARLGLDVNGWAATTPVDSWFEVKLSRHGFIIL